MYALLPTSRFKSNKARVHPDRFGGCHMNDIPRIISRIAPSLAHQMGTATGQCRGSYVRPTLITRKTGSGWWEYYHFKGEDRLAVLKGLMKLKPIQRRQWPSKKPATVFRYGEDHTGCPIFVYAQTHRRLIKAFRGNVIWYSV